MAEQGGIEGLRKRIDRLATDLRNSARHKEGMASRARGDYSRSLWLDEAATTAEIVKAWVEAGEGEFVADRMDRWTVARSVVKDLAPALLANRPDRSELHGDDQTEAAKSDRMTAEEFERKSAECRLETVEEFRAGGRVVVVCDCDYAGCEGWEQMHRELAERDGREIVLPPVVGQDVREELVEDLRGFANSVSGEDQTGLQNLLRRAADLLSIGSEPGLEDLGLAVLTFLDGIPPNKSLAEKELREAAITALADQSKGEGEG